MKEVFLDGPNRERQERKGVESRINVGEERRVLNGQKFQKGRRLRKKCDFLRKRRMTEDCDAKESDGGEERLGQGARANGISTTGGKGGISVRGVKQWGNLRLSAWERKEGEGYLSGRPKAK